DCPPRFPNSSFDLHSHSPFNQSPRIVPSLRDAFVSTPPPPLSIEPRENLPLSSGCRPRLRVHRAKSPTNKGCCICCPRTLSRASNATSVPGNRTKFRRETVDSSLPSLSVRTNLCVNLLTTL